MKLITVSTTCSTIEEAEKLAGQVLGQRLAACVQITSARSMYWWQQRIASENEYLLNMKSRRGLFERLAQTIREHHSYDVPEIVATEIVSVDRQYRQWLVGELAER
ncbi:MAG: divalent-cation tolerance protein CutA [Desulfocapsaceae bacterium]|jgi:periplasmic divalent cation tolerance protein|nr:divalent-cation tolerance protein CutA [Desulfocapsaceae bacterium]